MAWISRRPDRHLSRTTVDSPAANIAALLAEQREGDGRANSGKAPISYFHQESEISTVRTGSKVLSSQGLL